MAFSFYQHKPPLASVLSHLSLPVPRLLLAVGFGRCLTFSRVCSFSQTADASAVVVAITYALLKDDELRIAAQLHCRHTRHIRQLLSLLRSLQCSCRC